MNIFFSFNKSKQNFFVNKALFPDYIQIFIRYYKFWNNISMFILSHKYSQIRV